MHVPLFSIIRHVDLHTQSFMMDTTSRQLLAFQLFRTFTRYAQLDHMAIHHIDA